MLEGGAIDVDGTGLAVTTEQCLLNPNRNPGMNAAEIEERLRADLGKTSVFVTHDVQEAMKLATRIALLHEGNLAFIGTPAEFESSTHPEARAFLDVLAEARRAACA